MIKFAILTRPDYRSPRILAESLKSQIEKAGHVADVFFDIDVLTRLKNYSESNKSIKYHFWLRKKIKNLIKDSFLHYKLRNYDAIIISECTPNGFWRDLYHVEKFRAIIKKPIIYHEVYYLGNAPTQIDKLKKEGDATIERYDYHLAVTDVTEIRSVSNDKWTYIGLDMSDWNFSYKHKDEFVVLVDFIQDGYEKYQEEQIKVLEDLKIKYIVLKERYTIDEIRKIYKRSSVFFLQFPEAFGMPIAECLASGVQIFTPNSGWPMSWRLDENPEVHGPGKLPECFTVYDDGADLKKKLLSFKQQYDLKESPQQIFDNFLYHYPHLYYGNQEGISQLLNWVKNYTIV